MLSYKKTIAVFGALLVALIQGGFLNVYIYKYANSSFIYYVLLDPLMLILIAIAITIKKRYSLKWKRWFILSYWDNDFWLIYSMCLIIKVSFIFKTMSSFLDTSHTFGTTFLKLAIGLSSLVFILLCLRNLNSKNKECNAKTKAIIQSIPFNIFDSIDILEILFTQETRLIRPFGTENASIILGCMNFVFPYFSLLYLNVILRKSKVPFENIPKLEIAILLIHKFCNIALLNVPYLIIRVFLWQTIDHNVSTYVIKNLLYIIVDSIELFLLYKKIRKTQKQITNELKQIPSELESSALRYHDNASREELAIRHKLVETDC